MRFLPRPSRVSLVSGLACVFCLTALTPLAACTLLYGPSDELSAGSSSGSSSGADLDAAPADARDDGSSSGSGSSSGADAPVFVCPAGALVCDDFESGAPTAVLVRAGNARGTGIVAGGQASANALAATFRDGDPAMLQASFANAAHVELSLWIRVPTPPPAASSVNFRLASILFGGGCDWDLTWQIWVDTAGLHQGADTYDAVVNPSCGPVKFAGKDLLDAAQVFDGRWHHVVVDADASRARRTTSVRVDERPAVAEQIDTGRERVPSSTQLDVGVPCVRESGGCFAWAGPDYTVYFDQVTLTKK